MKNQNRALGFLTYLPWVVTSVRQTTPRLGLGGGPMP